MGPRKYSAGTCGTLIQKLKLVIGWEWATVNNAFEQAVLVVVSVFEKLTRYDTKYIHVKDHYNIKVQVHTHSVMQCYCGTINMISNNLLDFR